MISQRIRVCWGTGALGVALLMNAIGVLALFYMVSVLGIEPGLAGTLVFLTKLLDVVSDPIVGGWSDRIKSPAGRRRPFLLAGAFVSACAFALIFTTPVFETQWLTAAYVFLALSTYTVGYTLFNVPYMAMPAEMTDSYHERSAIHGYRMVFIATGVFLATSISPLILDRLGRENWNAYAVIGAGGGAVILISMLTTYFGTARARFTDAGVERINVFRQFSPILANPHFLRLIAVKAAQLL
ncbi:MAG: MFS transporter, partial [Gammaproteobacteria bacterium]|nr:MFS transporter [Gammaproteobacteria bacterium]